MSIIVFMPAKIQGYDFDGDLDGLKFLGFLSWDEFESLRHSIDDRGKTNVFDSKYNSHYEITKSSDDIYMVSKVQPSSSSSWL